MMEGPSLLLAARTLRFFKQKRVCKVEGNSKIGKERIADKTILDIFSWGKHLVFQFEDFALRIHFMMYGSFEAIYMKKKISGDYPTKNRIPRLRLIFDCGEINLYSCSLRYIESSKAKDTYDFTTDIMSPLWNEDKAGEKVRNLQDEEVADVLLDQSIFSGVGNIIKNETLFLTATLPTRTIKQLSLKEIENIIQTAKKFSHQFYQWRKKFVLRKHYRIYRQSVCPQCSEKVIRKKTGKRNRVSFYCTKCQK